MPVRVTAMPITTCGRSGRWSLEWPRARKPTVSPSPGVVGLLDLEVGGGGVEEQQVDLEVQQVGHREVHGLGQVGFDLEEPVHGPVEGVLVDLVAGPGSRPAPQPSGSRRAWRAVRAHGWRPSRRWPARPGDRDAARPAAGPAPRRSPPAATTRPAPTRRPSPSRTRTPAALPCRGGPRPPARLAVPGSGRWSAPAGPARRGPADPPGRSCGSPRPPGSPTRGDARCGPAARSGPPTRPCCGAGSSAGTCPQPTQSHLPNRGPQQQACAYTFRHPDPSLNAVTSTFNSTDAYISPSTAELRHTPTPHTDTET